MTTSGPSGSAPDDAPFFASTTRPVFVEPTDTIATGGEHFDDTDDELDSEFAPQPRKRLGKLTIGLAALLVAGAGFLGGVQVQQHTGSNSSTAGNGFAAAARRATGAGGTAASGGAGAGGFGNFGGAGGTGGGGRAGATSSAAAGATGGTGGTGGGASIPAVIGQIVSISGNTVVVKNLGGQMITVTLTNTTTVTQVGTVADLKPGQNVTVSGTTGADGTVSATAVGARN